MRTETRLKVEYTCDNCGHPWFATYFDYGYHRTERVEAPCSGCGYYSSHTPINDGNED